MCLIISGLWDQNGQALVSSGSGGLAISQDVWFPDHASTRAAAKPRNPCAFPCVNLLGISIEVSFKPRCETELAKHTVKRQC